MAGSIFFINLGVSLKRVIPRFRIIKNKYLSESNFKLTILIHKRFTPTAWY